MDIVSLDYIYESKQPSLKLPPGLLNWISAGLLSGRSRVQTPAGPTLRVLK